MGVSLVEQAGAVVVRLDRPEPEFLLVTARRNPDCWIFPKGHVEYGETAEEAAVREAEEEAGVTGRVIAPAGSARFERDGLDYVVAYFVVVTGDDGESREGRQLVWMPFAEAAERLTFPTSRRVLERARRALDGRTT
jgi:8-oxo-dGTP pyrophosphatase MutT (NUDIX family)